MKSEAIKNVFPVSEALHLQHTFFSFDCNLYFWLNSGFASQEGFGHIRLHTMGVCEAVFIAHCDNTGRVSHKKGNWLTTYQELGPPMPTSHGLVLNLGSKVTTFVCGRESLAVFKALPELGGFLLGQSWL